MKKVVVAALGLAMLACSCDSSPPIVASNARSLTAPVHRGGHGVPVPADIVDGQTGWGADDLASAYNIPTTLPTTATLAILAGGYDPTLESDLQVYRQHYGLPDCTADDGCLKVVNATGGTTFPVPRYEDIAESSLEVQVASAACPGCKLLVVVATDDPTRTPTLPELAAAARQAVGLGATAMITSYGASELDENGAVWAGPYEALFAGFAQVPLFAAAGDSGYLDGSSPDHAVRVPAAFPEVVAVGGTTLAQVPVSVSPRRWAETVLPTSSSGCSTSFAKPAWQHDTGCAHRMTNDIAAAADGALVYFTTVDPAGDDDEQPGWHVEGGTGEAAAVAAGVFAAAGQAYNGGPSYSYANPAFFNDLSGGSNGSCGAVPYLCSGQVGYDGPTGNGSPNGSVFQGTWLTLDGLNFSVPRGGSDGSELHTIGDWAKSCKVLAFHATGLPEGVSATFGGREYFFGNPYVQFGLSATLAAPLVQGARVSLVADCDGVVHTVTVYVDVVPCKLATSCLATDGIPLLCGETAPDGCGGTLACGECTTIYTCINGQCIAPQTPPGDEDH